MLTRIREDGGRESGSLRVETRTWSDVGCDGFCPLFASSPSSRRATP